MSQFFSNMVSDENAQIRETFTKFARREIEPFAHEWEEAGEFPRELYKKAGEAGLLGLAFPEHAGGSAGGAMATLMSIEGLMRGGSTGVTVGIGSLNIALPPIVMAGDKEQIDRFVRPTIAGDMIASLAITEPGTGSDVAGVKTRAVRDGDHYVINGSKLFITSGCRADILVALCRTGEDAHGGLTFFVIEKDMPGVSVSRALKKTGWWASDTAELAFDDVRVPLANRVGPEGSGFIAVMQNFQMERIALAGYGYMTALIACEEARRYSKERSAFGRPIAGFQVTRHKLADMFTRTLAAQTLAYQVAHQIDAGTMPIAEVSMAKNLCAETAMSVTYDAVQIFGGMGYMRETLVERLSRDARLLPIGGGTQEVMKEIISKQLDL